VGAFNPPPGLKRLIVAADADDKGMTAARALAERARSRTEVVILPAPAGTDWCDQVKGASNV
jgi:hypothetical protein